MDLLTKMAVNAYVGYKFGGPLVDGIMRIIPPTVKPTVKLGIWVGSVILVSTAITMSTNFVEDKIEEAVEDFKRDLVYRIHHGY